MERLCERLVGYDRLVGEHTYRQLTELYRALRLYVNCLFQAYHLHHSASFLRSVVRQQTFLMRGAFPIGAVFHTVAKTPLSGHYARLSTYFLS